MKPSKVYQRWIQIIGRGSDVLLFFSAYFLGKEKFIAALTLLILKLIIGYISSELVYKRMKAVIREENNGN